MLLVVLAAFCASCNDRGRPTGTQPDVRPTSEAVAVVSGVPVTAQQLDKEVGARAAAMQAQVYRLRRSVLDSMIARMLVEAEANRRGLAADELTRIEVAKRTTPVTPEEARAVYEAAKDRFSGTGETEALASITASMGQSRIQSARIQWVADLRKASNVSVMLEPPRVQIGAGKNPIRGAANAPVSIVVFTDYECPFCSRHLSTLKQLERQYGQSVSITIRDFPLPIHKRAVKAAEAAACARDQGRYWEMHYWLFANQQKLDPADIKASAATIGLDLGKFGRCLDGSTFAAEIEQERREGERAGVAGTPATFINGRLIPGAMAYDEYASEVDDELRRKSRQSTAVGSAR